VHIHNGDHVAFEIEHANTKPEDRPDWPLPSFDARDWAKAFLKVNPHCGLDEGVMIGWFANALMRGYDHQPKHDRVNRMELALHQIHGHGNITGERAREIAAEALEIEPN
jgi:hypothetical protein